MLNRGGPAAHPARWARWLTLAALPVLLPGEGAAQRLREVPEPLMRQVMPAAERFDPRGGDPPVFRAWRTDPSSGQPILVGFVFHTADLPPERRGYSGPVEALVGMDLEGRLTGVRVMDYWESLMSSRGDFLREPGVQEQFTGKHIGDAFAPRRDVDAVSRATISTQALALGVRDAARRVASAYLEVALTEVDPLTPLEDLDWLQLRERGAVVPMSVTGRGRAAAEVTLAYLESDPFGERLVGPEALAMSQRAWASRGSEGHVLFYGIDGPDVRLFQREGWSVVQDGDTIPIDPDAVRAFGLASGGLLDEQVVAGGVMIVGPQLDVSRPFRVVYAYSDDIPPFSVEYRTESVRLAAREAAAAAVAARVMPMPEARDAAPTAPDPVSGRSEGQTADSARISASGSAGGGSASGESAAVPDPAPVATGEATGPDAPLDAATLSFETTESVLERTLARTAWGRVLAMLALLVLATVAFVSKREGLRWVVVCATLGWLGFVDGGFLSVSHLTAAILVGPGVFLNDVSLLLLVAFTLVTTLVWGRVFCGFLCPFGALQDLLERTLPKRLQRTVPRTLHRWGWRLKYVVLAGLLVGAWFWDQGRLYAYVEPFGTVFFRSPSLVLWTIAGAILLASAVVPRFYCRYACPLGAALAVGSLLAFRRIPRVEQCAHCTVCAQDCPTGAIERERLDFSECVRCNVCEVHLSRKSGVCRHDMTDVRERLVQIRAGRRGERGAGGGRGDAASRAGRASPSGSGS